MGLKSKRKGRRGEQEIVLLARAAGLGAVRTWETAQSLNEVERKCDVLVDGKAAQVKLLASGLQPVYKALEGVCLAFVRQDRHEWLAILPAREFFKLLAPQEVVDTHLTHYI